MDRFVEFFCYFVKIELTQIRIDFTRTIRQCKLNNEEILIE